MAASAETHTHSPAEARDQGSPCTLGQGILKEGRGTSFLRPPARHKPVGKRKKADGGRAKRRPNEALEMLHELVRELGQDRSTDE